MRALTNRFPNIARHLTVLRESWRQQDEADRTRTEQTDYEFLPAALEIMEKPPSPGLRALLLTLCGLFTLAVAWSVFGKVDVVAVATGKTIPAGNVKIIQPIQIGSVRAIHVRDGDFVRAGQLLVDLDPTIASAEVAQSDQSLITANIARARNDALLSYLAGKPASISGPPDLPIEVARTQERLLASIIASYEAERASLIQQRAERIAERNAANFEVAKLRETLPYLDKQLEARRQLTEKGYFSKLKALEFEQARIEHIRTIDVQRAVAARATAAIADFDAQVARLRQNFERQAATELADASDKATVAEQAVRKARKAQELTQLRAPVDGVVQQLSISTIGGVVQPAQQLMVIVPCGNKPNSSQACRSAVEVEAFILNKDVGFVRTGQRVAVKLEAFNFTDYGLIEGRVVSISRNSVTLGDREEGQSTKGSASPVYIARVAIDCGGSDASDLCRRVTPGMNAQAEIKTGARRIIEYLLSPLSKAVNEAGRER